MAKDKKQGFFSWLRFGKNAKDEPELDTEAISDEMASLQQEDRHTHVELMTVETSTSVSEQKTNKNDNAITLEHSNTTNKENSKVDSALLVDHITSKQDNHTTLERSDTTNKENSKVDSALSVNRITSEQDNHTTLEHSDATNKENSKVDSALLVDHITSKQDNHTTLERSDTTNKENSKVDSALSVNRITSEQDNHTTLEHSDATNKENNARETNVVVINTTAAADDHVVTSSIESNQQITQEKPVKLGFFARLKQGLLKTRQNVGFGFISLFRGKRIDDDLFEELEEQLLIADIGVNTTRKIINSLVQHTSRKQLKDADALYNKLRDEMAEIIRPVSQPLDISSHTPFVILMVGVNGVGKTTTIGKLARQFQQQGKSVILAAGDTFRAAAVEQLQVWGQRNDIPVIAQHTGADSASVIYDAIQAAKARQIDVIIADTAGRLQNKSHLMEELKKIVRVLKKLDEHAPHEIMLTIDAGTGQNAVSQVKLFHEAIGLTGITLTKLDGTAKGGVIFAVADQFSIPIRYIGIGERIEDLRPFDADDFIEALFTREE